MERKAIDFEVKGLDESAGIIEGYASAYRDEPDEYNDRVRPGAFAKTIREQGTKIKVLLGHDPNAIVGRPIEMREDSYGLFTRTQLFLDDAIPEARKAYALAKLGAIDSLSIGFRPVRWEMRDDGGRDLTEIRLYEWSLVPWPADDKALITSVKSLPDDALLDRLALIADELKAGRMISAANAAKLRAAMQALSDLMAAAGMMGDDDDDDMKAAPEPETPARDYRRELYALACDLETLRLSA